MNLNKQRSVSNDGGGELSSSAQLSYLSQLHLQQQQSLQNPQAIVSVMAATPESGSDRTVQLQYTDTKVIGNGSFGVVYLAKLLPSGEDVAIKRVLQDK